MSDVTNSGYDFSIVRSLISLTGSLGVSTAIGTGAHYMMPIIPMEGSIMTSLTFGTATYLGQTLSGPNTLRALMITTALLGVATLALTQSAPRLAKHYPITLPLPEHMLAIGALNVFGQTLIIWLIHKAPSEVAPFELSEAEIKSLKKPPLLPKAPSEVESPELSGSDIQSLKDLSQTSTDEISTLDGSNTESEDESQYLPRTVDDIDPECYEWYSNYIKRYTQTWTDFSFSIQLAFKQAKPDLFPAITANSVMNLSDEELGDYYNDFDPEMFNLDTYATHMAVLQVFRARFAEKNWDLLGTTRIDFENFDPDDLSPIQKRWLYVIFNPKINDNPSAQKQATQEARAYLSRVPERYRSKISGAPSNHFGENFEADVDSLIYEQFKNSKTPVDSSKSKDQSKSSRWNIFKLGKGKNNSN